MNSGVDRDAPWIEDYEEYRSAYYGYYGIEGEQDEFCDEDLEFDLAREERAGY